MKEQKKRSFRFYSQRSNRETGQHPTFRIVLRPLEREDYPGIIPLLISFSIVERKASDFNFQSRNRLNARGKKRKRQFACISKPRQFFSSPTQQEFQMGPKNTKRARFLWRNFNFRNFKCEIRKKDSFFYLPHCMRVLNTPSINNPGKSPLNRTLDLRVL